MYRAIELATELVAPNGVFVFALYRKTRLCWLWLREKRWYMQASPSQQRFARRRDNQARQANEAAADHAARILRRGPLVTGGDHVAVDEVLADPRLRTYTVVEPWLPVPDPRRAVLDQAIRDAASVRVRVVNA